MASAMRLSGADSTRYLNIAFKRPRAIMEQAMPSEKCPRCGSDSVAMRMVSDRIRAALPHGQTFEIALHLPMCRCSACKFSWQGQEASAAKEVAYQNALLHRLTKHATV